MTEGRRALLAILGRTTRANVAARCRVSKGTVDKWCSGVREPSRAARLQIQVNYGIAFGSWDIRIGLTG